MSSKIGIIIAREFSERVKKKSFIVTTILMPLFMIAMMVAPVLIMSVSESDTKEIFVIDDSGIIADRLTDNDDVKFQVYTESLDSARANSEIFGVLLINKDVMTRPNGIKLYTNESSTMSIEGNISSQIKKIIENEKLRAYNIDNISKILDEVKTNVSIQTFRNDTEDDEVSSATLAYFIGFILSIMLYTILLMYGQMVMTSIIEEKSNRVLEVMVSSIKPFELMFGKIVGVGLVAVTQIVIWGIIISSVTGIIMPMLLPADVAQQVAAMNAGTLNTGAVSSFDMDMLQTLSILSNVNYIIQLFVYLLLFLIGGYLFYSAIFAAVGSAVENIQDGSQLQGLAVYPILIGFIISVSITQDPNSSLALWASIIPFTSPMVMMTRVPFGIPTWEIILSIVVLYISFCFMVWIAAKIYRVGIFMYGKKPTFKEMIKWITYK